MRDGSRVLFLVVGLLAGLACGGALALRFQLARDAAVTAASAEEQRVAELRAENARLSAALDAAERRLARAGRAAALRPLGALEAPDAADVPAPPDDAHAARVDAMLRLLQGAAE